MKKKIIKTAVYFTLFYGLLLILLHFNQEKVLFFPEKLQANHQFRARENVIEKNIETNDGVKLNGLLFKVKASKGLVFYLHGNGGSLRSWQQIAPIYNQLGYDIFMFDYRGFGKSEGEISSQEQLLSDVETVYRALAKDYPQEKIIIIGYSLGTGLASYIASRNKAKLLILQAPYYSLTDVMNHNYPFLPDFILKYKINTSNYLEKCQMPIVIFHGKNDKVIYFESSVKLKKRLDEKIQFFPLKNQGHNGINYNLRYQEYIKKVFL